MVVKARIQYMPQYVTELRQVTGMYIGYIPNEYADSPSSDSYYEVLKNDPAIAHSLHLLSIMACGEYYEIECQDKLLKKLIMRALSGIEDFTHARKSLIYGGVLFGLGIQKKYWEKERWKEYQTLVWDVPKQIKEVDRRRLRIERDPKDRNKMYWTIYCPLVDSFVVLEDKAIEPYAELSVQDFIWYIHEWEELNPYHRGLGDILYHLAYIKSKVIQYWADLCESWSKPFMTVFIDAAKAAINAALGTGFPSAEARVNKIISDFESARSRHMVVMDKSDKIEFNEAGSTGNNILSDLMNYADTKIQLAILGAELTTGAPSVGSYALGQIHRGATQSIIQYNRLRLEEVLARDLVYDFILRNRKNFVAMGMDIPTPGEIKFKIRVQTEENLKNNPDALAKSMGG